MSKNDGTYIEYILEICIFIHDTTYLCNLRKVYGLPYLMYYQYFLLIIKIIIILYTKI